VALTKDHGRGATRAVLARLFDTRPSVVGLDVAVIAVRIVLVWIFVYYGAGKLFGTFNGPGLHRTAAFFSTTAHLHPGGFFAVLGGIIELGGAIAIGVGFLSRAASLLLLGDQVMAMITVTWAHGLNSVAHPTGYEFNLTLIALALVIAALGAGRYSIDAVIGRSLRGAKDGAPSSATTSTPTSAATTVWSPR